MIFTKIYSTLLGAATLLEKTNLETKLNLYDFLRLFNMMVVIILSKHECISKTIDTDIVGEQI